MDYFYEKLKEKAINGQEIIKEYNLFEEIDKRLFDEYIIEGEQKYVQLGYGIQEKVELDNLKLFRFGSLIKEDESILLVPEIDMQINDSIKRSQIFMNKPVSPRATPVIHLNFEINELTETCIWLGNDYVFDIYNSYMNGVISWDTDRKRSTSFKRTAISIDASSINIAEYYGMEKTNKDKGLSIPNSSNNVDCYIDLQEGYLKLGQDGKKVYHSGIKQHEVCSINISCNTIEQKCFSKLMPGLTINKFELCKNNGIVYFEPVVFPSAKELRVLVFHKGDVAVQYFSRDRKEWLPVKENIKLREFYNMSLRALMHAGDRIYDLVVLKIA